VLKVLAIATPADYIILNQRTGERIIIQAATEQCDLRIKIPSPTAGSRNGEFTPSPTRQYDRDVHATLMGMAAYLILFP
jgi:hypothetical protein